MAHVSLKKTIGQYRSLAQSLETKIQQLYSKREELASRAFVVIEETPRTTPASSPAQNQQPNDAVVSILNSSGRKLSTSREFGAINERGRNRRSTSPPNFDSVLSGEVTERDSAFLARREELDDLVWSGNNLAASLGPSERGRRTSREPIPSVLEERVMAHSSDITSLVSTATNILIESMQLKLSYVQEVLNKLVSIQQESHKLPTPPELLFSRYEEWVQRNQRLIELNVQLYDLEKLKFELKEKRSKVQVRARREEGEVERTLTGSQFVQSSVQRIQTFFSQLQFNTTTSERTRAFLVELLDPKGVKMTLEAQKLQEYVAQCLQPPTAGAEIVEAAGPDQYREFMAILCGYIVEKQREVQGEELPFDLVFSTVESHLIPKILPAILRHVAQPERDLKIQMQCERFQDVTLNQLRVKTSLQSQELVPFISSISQLRASYFTPTPTGKMYAVVAAAKALYEQLGEMGESSIDGDSFLDLWIYVIIKAEIKDLATNLRFMEGYGNPRLSMDEAGYYLTTLEAAAAFIEGLKPEHMRPPEISEYVVCERERFKELSALPGTCIEVVSEWEELEGYKVAMVKDWALNKTRLFKAVLMPTGDSSDTAVVSVIRLSAEHSTAAHVEYFTKKFTEPQNDLEGLKSVRTALGLTVVADVSSMDPRTLITLPTSDYDSHHDQLTYVVQLIRLGCEFRDTSRETVDLPSSVTDRKDGEDYVYVFSPPEDSLYLAPNVDVHRNIERSTQSILSQRSIQRSQSSRGSGKSKVERSSWRSKSKSPEPSDDVQGLLLPNVLPHQRPASPYLLNYSSNKYQSDRVSLDTFPADSPQRKDTLEDENEVAHSPARKVWGLFQWRKKKSNKSFNSRASLPPIRGDSHREMIQASQANSNTLDFGVSLYGAGSDDGSSLAEEGGYREVGRLHRRVSFDASDSYAIGSKPNTVTVEVEVHDMDASMEMNSETPLINLHQPTPSPSSSSTTDAQQGNHSPDMSQRGFLSLPEGSQKSAHQTRRRILSFGTAHEKTKQAQKSHTNTAEDVLSVPLLQADDQKESSSCNDSYERESSLSSSVQTSSFIESNHSSSFSESVVDCLSDDFVQKLEQNFKKDHLLREINTELKEAVVDTVRQGQLYLQRLNYLSTTHKLDGVFTNATLAAVKMFQLAHNAHESKYSIFLPSNGYLTAATLQYLRQAFFTVYASLLRLGFEPECGESFNPTSAAEENVKAFFLCVKKFQDASQLPVTCQNGVLNEITVKTIKQSVRKIQRTM